MTIKEYVQSKSVSVEITDLQIQGMLLVVGSISDCIQEGIAWEETSLEDYLLDEVTLVLTFKGRELLEAELYYLLARTFSDNKRVTADGVTISTSKSFGVNDRQDFREFGDEIYAKWGVKNADSNILCLTQYDALC